MIDRAFTNPGMARRFTPSGLPGLRLIPALLLLLATAASAPSYHYRLDAGHSTVDARVAFLGLASKTAHFPRISGAISLSPDHLEAINLDVELDARALTAGDSLTQQRLRGADFFDVARYPTVRFSGQRMAMTSPTSARIDGEITARGITRPATLAVNFRSPPAASTGHEAIMLNARTIINRNDFGMTSYGLIVGKKVTITINALMQPGN